MRYESLLRREGVTPYFYHNVLTGIVTSEEQGIAVAAALLYSMVDTKTVVYLSGGRTPKRFYELLAKEEKLFPAAVGLVDERFGPLHHKNSNELMIGSTGLLRYLLMRDIRFCPILRADVDRNETAESYDALVRSLHSTFPKSMGILGIGLDGHTAGIPAQSSGVKIQNSDPYISNEFVVGYNDESEIYGERVTMTFLGLSVLDFLLVLVFGKDKQQALKMVFSEGSEMDVPGRFYKRPDIAEKTILITDQTF